MRPLQDKTTEWLQTEMVACGALLAELRRGDRLSVMLGEPPDERMIILSPHGENLIRDGLDRSATAKIEAIKDELQHRKEEADAQGGN